MAEDKYLEISRLGKTFLSRAKSEPMKALDDINISVPRGTFLTLLGPSGCGKSTLLNSVSGLQKPTVGRIIIDGRPVFDSYAGVSVPSGRRDISMVFQSYAIWPHMTVYDNIAFPLKHGIKRKEYKGGRLRAEVMRSLDAVGMAEFADRPAPFLSGGQQQRVSLARALAQRTQIILLDEPLSNLDANLRDQMQGEITRIISENELTALYVTHDQKEAMSMADLIAVMDKGRVQQIATPEEIYKHPTNRMVANFVGKPNILEVVIGASRGTHYKEVKNGWIKLLVDVERSTNKWNLGDKAYLMIRQESWHVIDPSKDDKNNLTENFNNNIRAQVVKRTFHGQHTELQCRVDDNLINVNDHSNCALSVGDRVMLHVAPNEMHLISK